MKEFNLSKGTLYFPLKDGEEVINGAIYEVVNGKAQRVTSSTITGTVIGVSAGGNRVKKGYIMLDIDPTAVYSQPYTETAPEIGTLIDGCKLVVGVNAEDGRFTYLLRLPSSGGGYVLPTASASTLGGVKIGEGLEIDENSVLSVTGGSGEQATVTLPKLEYGEEPVLGAMYDLFSGEYSGEYMRTEDYVAVTPDAVVGKCIATTDDTVTFTIDENQIYESTYFEGGETPAVGNRFGAHFYVLSVNETEHTFEGVLVRAVELPTPPMANVAIASEYENPQINDIVIIEDGEANLVGDGEAIPVNAVSGVVTYVLSDTVDVTFDTNWQGYKAESGKTTGTIVNGHEFVTYANEYGYQYMLVKTDANKLVVHITMTDETTLTTDASSSEIYDAFAAGKDVVAILSAAGTYVIFYPTMLTTTQATFSYTTIAGTPEEPMNYVTNATLMIVGTDVHEEHLTIGE